MRTPICLLACLTLAGSVIATGCTGGTRVTRNDPNATEDLSGGWNAEDSRRVAEKMISDSLTRPWHEQFRAAQGRKPMVQVGRVVVRSNGDVIDTDIFTNDLRRSFINSGLVGVVAKRSEAEETRLAQLDQEARAREETRSRIAAETGADFLIQGTILVQDDRLGNRIQKFYSIDLILTNIETQEQVWIGNEKIAKIVQTDKFR